MRKTSPGPYVISEPSFERTVIVPERTTPLCRVMQNSVPAIGLTSSDQRQPGSNVARPIVKSPKVTTST